MNDNDDVVWGNLGIGLLSAEELMLPNAAQILMNRITCQSPERNKKISDFAYKRWENEDARECQRQWQKEVWSNEELLTRHKQLMKEIFASEEIRNKLSKNTTELWQSEEYRQKIENAWTEDKRQKQKQKIIGKNSALFKGVTVGIHIETGERIELIGSAAIKEAGFNKGAISECINGKKNQYKGYRWHREPIVKDSE